MDNETTTVPLDEARQAVHDIGRRIGLLHMSYARVLVDELGEEMGVALIKKAIRAYGTRVGERIRERVLALGLEPTVENFDKGSDLSPIGFDHREVVVDGESRSQSPWCTIAELWREYDEEELGGLYCLVDPAKMQAYDPNWTMVHTKRIPAGDECCEMAVRQVRRT